VGVVDNVKEIADLVKKIGDLELYRKILNLEGEVIDLTHKNRSLEEENRQLKRKGEFAVGMSYTEPFWYAEGDKIPFCPQCWEADEIAVHLLYAGLMSGGHRYDCPKCKYTFCSKHTPMPGHK